MGYSAVIFQSENVPDFNSRVIQEKIIEFCKKIKIFSISRLYAFIAVKQNLRHAFKKFKKPPIWIIRTGSKTDYALREGTLDIYSFIFQPL